MAKRLRLPAGRSSAKNKSSLSHKFKRLGIWHIHGQGNDWLMQT